MGAIQTATMGAARVGDCFTRSKIAVPHLKLGVGGARTVCCVACPELPILVLAREIGGAESWGAIR